ncbi:MAG: PEP-CTERM sorting domain-containing protein [Sedimentisphaerales bacterium]|nr:PEP-CTERM sorting domain-containing protein [Sedimentisphaerales bacterium]
MESQSSQHVLKALEIADQLLALADSDVVFGGDGGDESGGIIAAVMRDCAYKIQHHAATKHKIVRTKTKDGESVWRKQLSEGIDLKKAMVLLLVFVLSLSAQVAQAAYVDVVDALNPLGYWRLGESSGTTATDYGGNYNGTYSATGVTLGATGTLSGDSDTAATFDGTIGILDVGPTADLLLTADLSVSFWVKPASFTTGTTPKPLFTLSADALNTGTAKLAELAVDKNGDIVYTHQYGNQGSSVETYTFDTADLLLDTWYNITLIRDSGAGDRDVYLYIGDSLLGTYSYTEEAEGYTEGDLSIGGYGGNKFAGTIDEFAIFGSQLTGQNVIDIYNAAQVPEPATIMILGLGAAVLVRRRK